MKLRLAVVLALFVTPFALRAQAVVSGVEIVHRSVEGTAGAVAYTGIKNAPFSADVFIEYDRVLADGNRIHQEQHGREIRDSQGRTRDETEITGAGPKIEFVVICDPVQQRIINLSPSDKTARVIDLTATAKQAAPARPTASKTGTLGAEASTTTRTGPTFKSEDLGTKEIDGITVVGHNNTTTTPPGAMGNEREIVSSTETWVSPELGIVVLSTTTDPQSGTTTRKLQNIQKGEPDPNLFEIPAGYTVEVTAPDYVIDKQAQR